MRDFSNQPLAAVLLAKARTRSSLREKIGNDLTVLMKKTAKVWSMCHITKMAVSISTNNACRVAKLLKGRCTKKLSREKKDTPRQVQSRTFQRDTENVRLHIRQAMLGELASFLTEA